MFPLLIFVVKPQEANLSTAPKVFAIVTELWPIQQKERDLFSKAQQPCHFKSLVFSFFSLKIWILVQFMAQQNCWVIGLHETTGTVQSRISYKNRCIDLSTGFGTALTSMEKYFTPVFWNYTLLFSIKLKDFIVLVIPYGVDRWWYQILLANTLGAFTASLMNQ